MNNLTNELTFDLSEKLFEGGCAINSKRIKILTHSFLKLCEQSPKFQELFKDELTLLHKLDEKEKEYQNSLHALL